MVCLFGVFIYLMQQPLDQSNTNGNVGFGFGGGLPGGQLLSTALGVTRAVTQFLGSALQVNASLLFLLTVAIFMLHLNCSVAIIFELFEHFEMFNCSSTISSVFQFQLKIKYLTVFLRFNI